MGEPRYLGSIRPQPPYDFALTLDVVRRYAHPSVDHARDDAYVRCLRLPDASRVLVRVHADTGQPPGLHVHLLAASREPDDAAVDAILAQVTQVLGTDLDMRPFYTAAREHPALWKLVEPLQGVRMLRSVSLFEALAVTVIEQQIAWTSAQRAQAWLVAWAGDGLVYNGETFYAFPTPEQIAAATVEDLTPMKITFKRMRLLIDIAGQVVVGTLDLESLRAAPPSAMYTALLALKGIGHWTATYAITRSHGPLHPYVGTNDVALQAAVNRYFYGGEGRIPPAQVEATFAPFGEFAGTAALHTVLRWVRDRYGHPA